MKLRLALAAATCLALPIAAQHAAHAQPVTGPYVSLGAGVTGLYPVNTDSAAAGVSGKMQTRIGPSFEASAGYGFGNGLRVELEGNYFRNTAHRIDGAGGASEAVSGGLNTYGVFANALYDIPVGLPIFPYVGAGVGYEWQKLSPHVTGAVPGGYAGAGGTQGSVAWQLIAGVAYPVDFLVPGLSITAEYRFSQMVESRNYTLATNVPGASGSFKLGQESSNTVMLGLRYALFQPPQQAPAPTPAPAPVAAPAPAPARTYLVFFDWDKADLTPRATQIIAQAAADSQHQNTTTINVSGYTDTSGTPAYNDKLSMRRAVAVENQLVADGVSKSEIAVQAYGETHLLVPTGPGVREPQNRRVEIVLN